ncbi:MAG: DMT family transporter [Methanobacteriota archaeon]|nr:MAG: DMT family transporter [Euryarchaeota archaeon]
MDAPLLAPDDRRVAPDRRRADPERTARLAGVAPQRPVRVLGGVWPEESLGPRVHLRGGTGSGRTTSRLERVVVCRCERHPSGGNRSVSRGHPGPRRSLEPGEGLSRSLSSSPCFRFFDQGHPMALRWGLGFAVMSIMVAFAANSVMTRYIIVGGLATPYLLSTVRFASGFAMLLALQVAFPGPASRVPTAVNLVGGLFLGAYAFAISFGYLFISAAAGTLVFFAFVVLTMALFGYLHDGDRPSRRSVAGQLLSVLGVGVITVGGIRDVSLPGILLMAATGASWGLYSVHGRSAPDSRGYTFATFLFVGAAALAGLPVLGLFAPSAVSVQLTWNGIGLALFMGMITTALSYIVWNATLRRLSASQGGIVQLLVPVLASGMGIGLLGEHVTLSLVVGGASVLAGIYLTRVQPK